MKSCFSICFTQRETDFFLKLWAETYEDKRIYIYINSEKEQIIYIYLQSIFFFNVNSIF